MNKVCTVCKIMLSHSNLESVSIIYFYYQGIVNFFSIPYNRQNYGLLYGIDCILSIPDNFLPLCLGQVALSSVIRQRS